MEKDFNNIKKHCVHRFYLPGFNVLKYNLLNIPVIFKYNTFVHVHNKIPLVSGDYN